MGAAVKKLTSGLWWLVLLRGIIVLAFGVAILAWTGLSTTLLIQFLGASLLFTGALALGEAILNRVNGSRTWALVYGVAGIIVGILILSHPYISDILLVATAIAIMGLALIVLGLINVIHGLQGVASGLSS